MGQLFNRPGSNLATIARETGFPVQEVPGWTTHHHGSFSGHVGAVVCHHTAGPEPERTSSNYPSLRVVRDGRAGLPGPLSNYGIGYDGTIYVISAGTCWHAGRGGWNGMWSNAQAIGIEAEDGGDGDWTAAQLDVYPRLCAVICQFLGVDAGAVCGHKEWCSPPGRKIDPAGINMADFRSQVAHYIAHPDLIHRSAGAAPVHAQEEDDLRDDERAALFQIQHELLGPRGDQGQIAGWNTVLGPRTVVAMLMDLHWTNHAPIRSGVAGSEYEANPRAYLRAADAYGFTGNQKLDQALAMLGDVPNVVIEGVADKLGIDAGQIREAFSDALSEVLPAEIPLAGQIHVGGDDVPPSDVSAQRQEQ